MSSATPPVTIIYPGITYALTRVVTFPTLRGFTDVLDRENGRREQ